MKCMKCGRDTEDQRVFCVDCLLEMEKQPVDPNIPVLLPKRDDSAAKKPPKRRGPPTEEQVKALQKRCRVLFLLMLIGWALALVLAKPAVQYLMEDHFALGQNYSTIITPETAAPETTGTE